MLLLAASLLLIPASGPNAALAAVTLTPAQQKLVEQARAFDPLQENKPRATIKGGFTTSLGLQFHRNCFDLLGSTLVSREQAERNLDAVVFDAFERIALKCPAKHPELDKYFREWITMLRRSVIVCTAKKRKELDYSAMNLNSKGSLKPYLSARETAELETPSFFKLGSFSSDHKPTILYPSDTFVSAAVSTPSDLLWDSQLLIHEVLHSTSANNRRDHNDVEKIGPGKAGACGNDVGIDRINMITAMCADEKLDDDLKITAEDYVFKRTNLCGPRQCEKLFADPTVTLDLADVFDNFYTPTSGLKLSSARRVCARMYEEGACRHDLALQGEKITATKFAELNRIGALIRERLYELFPHTPAQLHPRVLDLAPGYRDSLRALSGDPCFKSVFKDVVGGALYVRDADLGEARTPSERFYATINAARMKIARAPECGTFWPAYNLRGILDGLNYQVASKLFYKSAYSEMIQYRYQNKAEISFEPAFMQEHAELRELVGGELFDSYLAAVRKYHYKSPEFRCSELRAIKR